MKNHITGLHHITALSSDAQLNVDFYAGVLGMRLVKRTVNFDATDVHHLYYGNEKGDPGTILTFFPIPGIEKGNAGYGQASVISFSVPEKSLEYWMNRFHRFDISFNNPADRFDETVLYFEDWDGLGLELVANNKDDRQGFTYGNIPGEYAIRGFYGVTLQERNPAITADLLTQQMDHALIAEKDNRFRFAAGSQSGGYVDIILSPMMREGVSGFGTVHHIAFATPDDHTQAEFRKKLVAAKTVYPTQFVDRQYFHSIYFREPGGVLFEAATCNLGFTIDEPVEHLGENLKLPSWEEKNRNRIEMRLDPLKLNLEKFSDYAQIPGNERR